MTPNPQVIEFASINTLDSVAHSSPVPPDTPDEASNAEQRVFSNAGKLAEMTPTARHLHATERLISGLERQLEIAQLENQALKRRLDVLAPEYAALHEACRRLTESVNFGSISQFTGSIVLGLAGLTNDWMWRVAYLAAGATLAILGLSHSLLAVCRGWIDSTLKAVRKRLDLNPSQD